jgi:pfkB family carbohydrate kinase
MAIVLSPQTKFENINLEEIKEKGLPVEDLFQMLKPAIVCLLEKGIKLLLITLGSNGLFLCHQNLDFSCKIPTYNSTTDDFLRQLYQEVNGIYYNGSLAKGSSEFCAFHFPAISAEVVSVIGAGDCLVGGTLAGICAGLDVKRSVAVGVVAAKAAVESENNVPDKFFMTNIRGTFTLLVFSWKLILFTSIHLVLEYYWSFGSTTELISRVKVVVNGHCHSWYMPD